MKIPARTGGVLVSLVMIAATALAAWCIAGHYGLLPGCDFGCGQYYYTDIPDWPKYFCLESVADHYPHALYYALFFLWGFVVYRLWRWVDRPRRGQRVYRHEEPQEKHESRD